MIFGIDSEVLEISSYTPSTEPLSHDQVFSVAMLPCRLVLYRTHLPAIRSLGEIFGRVVLHGTSTERSVWLCYTEGLKMRSADLSSTLDRLWHAFNLKSKLSLSQIMMLKIETGCARRCFPHQRKRRMCGRDGGSAVLALVHRLELWNGHRWDVVTTPRDPAKHIA
jgi:hypothetical protein